jgi:hypothetical protein
MAHELAIVSDKAEKDAELLDIRRFQPQLDGIHLGGVSADSRSADNVPQIRDALLAKVAFAQFDLPLIIGK